MAKKCTLLECPPGVFQFKGELCVKTQYSTDTLKPDAYILRTGAYFWGCTKGDVAARAQLVVKPIRKELK